VDFPTLLVMRDSADQESYDFVRCINQRASALTSLSKTEWAWSRGGFADSLQLCRLFTLTG
jgi:hypothetical protein